MHCDRKRFYSLPVSISLICRLNPFGTPEMCLDSKQQNGTEIPQSTFKTATGKCTQTPPPPSHPLPFSTPLAFRRTFAVVSCTCHVNTIPRSAQHFDLCCQAEGCLRCPLCMPLDPAIHGQGGRPALTSASEDVNNNNNNNNDDDDDDDDDDHHHQQQQ